MSREETKNKIEELEKKLTSKGYKSLFAILLFSFLVPIIYFLINFNSFIKFKEFKNTTLLSLIVSLFAYRLTYKMIPVFMTINRSKNIFGIDINKVEDPKDLSDPNRREVPEALGIVTATVFLIATIILKSILPLDIKTKLEFTSCLFSICFMVFLGFTDDILDLRWRYKLVLPTIASFPLLLAYSGSTSIFLPQFLQQLLGIRFLDIGFFFHIYMAMLAVFCTNSINIYAGINGLEVGQSVIIGISIIFYNLMEFLSGNVEKSLFSIAVLLPFTLTSLALFVYNSYPARCFIGDTYCYFAGMTFACVGILGNFPITLLIFFIPQILNFLISLPQLFGIIPCPRHRLPKFNSKTKLLTGKNENWNLLNMALRIIGPSREQDICNYLLIFQIICSIVALLIKFYLIY